VALSKNNNRSRHTTRKLKSNNVSVEDEQGKNYQTNTKTLSIIFFISLLSTFPFFFVFLIIISSQMMTNPNVDEVVTL
jgi:hypothetical protein